MNFKQILSIFLICTCAIMFCACGGINLKDNPETNSMVYGNGGIAVEKGEYIYYMNGFVSQADIKSKDDNKYGSVVNGGIYRLKLSNGAVKLDKYDKISNAECVVPKVAGYENGSLYIFGDLMFYTSPNVELDKNGKLLTELVDFYVVNINGTDNQRLYTSKNEFSKVKYGMKKYNDKVYLIMLDGDELKTISFSGNKASGVTTLASKVNEALWSNQENFDANEVYDNEFDSYIYYTTNPEEGAGNILKKVSIVDNKSNVLSFDNATEYSLKAIGSDRIYYTTKKGNIQDLLYSNKLNSENFINSQSNVLVANKYSNYYYVQGGDKEYQDGLLISDSANGTKFISNLDNSVSNISSEAHNLLFNKGNVIYTRTSSAMIYEIDINLDKIECKEILGSDAKAKTDANKYVDYSKRFILYYGEYKNGSDETKYYMHIVDTIKDGANLGKDYLISSLAEKDVIKEDKEVTKK